jgi:hypothetical protein
MGSRCRKVSSASASRGETARTRTAGNGAAVGLMTGTAVDALPQQVRVPPMPGVLLDHVHQDVPDRYGAVAVWHLGAEVVPSGQPRVGRSHFTAPRGPGVLHHVGFSHGAVEVEVAVLAGA